MFKNHPSKNKALQNVIPQLIPCVAAAGGILNTKAIKPAFDIINRVNRDEMMDDGMFELRILEALHDIKDQD